MGQDTKGLTRAGAKEEGEVNAATQLEGSLFDTVLAAASDTYGVDPCRILGRTRVKHAVVARHAVVWALRQAGQSWYAIGRSVGRNHATCIHAARQTGVRNFKDKYAAKRNQGILDACGIGPDHCREFLALLVDDRPGDFHDPNPGDMCQRPRCGKSRRSHKEQTR